MCDPLCARVVYCAVRRRAMCAYCIRQLLRCRVRRRFVDEDSSSITSYVCGRTLYVFELPYAEYRFVFVFPTYRLVVQLLCVLVC